MPKRVLLSGYYGFANAGDEAVLAGLILSLRAADPRLQITVLSINPRQTEAAHGVKAVHRYRPQELIPAVAGTDLLLSGGGSLLQDITSAHGIFYYLGVVRLAQMLGKRTMFGAQGLGPLQRPRSRRLVAFVANRLDAVTVRDTQSAALLREIGVHRPPVEVVADPALLLGHLLRGHPQLRSSQPGCYGVALRPWHGQENLANRLARACDMSLPEAQPVVFPMQPGTDTAMGEQFMALHGPKHAGRIFSATDNLAGLMGEIGGCEVMVGMRLHALILAAAQGIPSVALSYDLKVRAFMEQSGQGDAVFDLARENDQSLAGLLGRHWKERRERAGLLRERLPALRALAERTAQVAVSLTSEIQV